MRLLPLVSGGAESNSFLYPLVVLEAKSEDKNPLVGKEQARTYAKSQKCRFVILSNGNLHYFWDLEQGNLPKELRSKGITLPSWAGNITKAVDITTHVFDVALSFPGEARSFVEQVALELERLIGPNSYFYDNNYVSQLARPSLDVLLQDKSLSLKTM